MTRQVNPKHQFSYAGTNLFVYHADIGDGLARHTHIFNHAIFCASGSCVVRVKNKEIVITTESQPVDLPAHFPHEIEALEDKTVFVTVFAEGTY